MNTRYFTKTLMIYVLFALLLTACGAHSDPLTGRPVQNDLKDYLAAAFGWGSWDEMTLAPSQPLLISIANEDEENEFILAFPQALIVGSVGDKALTTMLENGAASAIGPGELYAARMQSTLYSIQQAFSGNPNSQIWQDAAKRYIVTLLPNGGNAWHMGVVDLQTRSMFMLCQALQNCGSFMHAETASELAQAMKDAGWKLIPASAVPSGIRSYFLYRMGWLRNAFWVRLQGTVTSPLVLPVGTFFIPQSILLPGNVDWENQPQQ